MTPAKPPPPRLAARIVHWLQRLLIVATLGLLSSTAAWAGIPSTPGGLSIQITVKTPTASPPPPGTVFAGGGQFIYTVHCLSEVDNPHWFADSIIDVDSLTVPLTTTVDGDGMSIVAYSNSTTGSSYRCVVNQESRPSAPTGYAWSDTPDSVAFFGSFTTTGGSLSAGTATFINNLVPTYLVTASAGTGGTLSCGSPAAASTTVVSGAATTCTATPNTGYTTASISGCGGTATGAGVDSYTTGAVTTACTVGASFAVVPVSQAALSVSASPASIALNTNSILSTSGGSGTGAVSYAVTAGASYCSIGGSTLTGTGVGPCTVTATKAADANYTQSTATVDVQVGKASQTISFTTAPSTLQVGGVAGGATGTLAATTSATGLSVGFSSATPAVCTVTGSTVTAVTAGTCTVAADQAGNDNYTAATQVTKSITITAAPLTSVSGTTPAGVAITAAFTGGSATCGYQTTAFSAASSVATAPPAGVSFPQGLFGFTTNDQCAGNTLTFTLTYAQALPAGAKYYKFGPEAGNTTPHWYVLGSAVITTTGNTSTVTFSITDNGVGDSDLTNTGVIADPGGPGVLADVVVGNPTPVPTLGDWGLLLLAGLMGLVGLVGIRARRTL